MKRIKKTIACVLAATSIAGIIPIYAHAAWKKDNIGWWYTQGNSYVSNSWKKIDGKWYYFTNDGYMKTGWLKYSGDWYYMNGDGAMENGWIQDRGVWYYLDPYQGGKMAANQWMCMGYHLDVNGAWDCSAKHLRNDIMKNSGRVKCKSGAVLYEAGDPSPLTVINGEPCLFTMTSDDQFREIGMNTLNVYGDNGTVVDTAILE